MKSKAARLKAARGINRYFNPPIKKKALRPQPTSITTKKGNCERLLSRNEGDEMSSDLSLNSSLKRTSLNGKWILNRNRGSPSVRGFLETMGVSGLAIEANEKGEKEHDTIHEITLTDSTYRIKKLSRVNDLTLEVNLGEEHVKCLLPGERIKRTLATSDNSCHVKVESR